MIKMDKFKSLINNVIERIFLIVFPPKGEESMLQVDIRIGLVLKNNPDKLITIGTDLDDIWTPVIDIEPVPTSFYQGFLFEERIKKWMRCEVEEDIIIEYFDVTNLNTFQNIIEKQVKEVLLIKVEGNDNPFGLKLIFENDYIISFPNSDGNTIETKFFNRNENIINFLHLGNITYSKI